MGNKKSMSIKKTRSRRASSSGWVWRSEFVADEPREMHATVGAPGQGDPFRVAQLFEQVFPVLFGFVRFLGDVYLVLDLSARSVDNGLDPACEGSVGVDGLDLK